MEDVYVPKHSIKLTFWVRTYILFHQIPIKFIIQTSVIWACKEWAKWFGQLRVNIIQNININD